MSNRLSLQRFLPSLLIAVVAAGCGLLHRSTASAPPPARPVAAPPPAIDLTKIKPNEVGYVPILMYHSLVPGTPGYLKYNIDQFRKDLEWLYDHNYRPVSLSDFVRGRVDCPAGTSPVILTFDDALPTQFKYGADGQIDPNCAVGIMDAFHAEHPDWPTRGCFFVLTDENPKRPPPFYQREYAQGKLEYLIKEGYDVENHTVNHLNLRRQTPDRIRYEIAMAIPGIQKYLPGHLVDILALPEGAAPHNMSVAVSGSSGGQSYHNVAVLKAGWMPEVSSVSKEYKPYNILRISPGSGLNESYYWLNKLDNGALPLYVSDGDPNTITINSILIGEVDKSQIAKFGLRLRTYTGAKFD